MLTKLSLTIWDQQEIRALPIPSNINMNVTLPTINSSNIHLMKIYGIFTKLQIIILLDGVEYLSQQYYR